MDGIRVFDGVRDIGLRNLSWQGDRITSVEPSEEDSWPDLCVLPGLVDTHVHLCGFAGDRDDPAARDTFTWPLVTTREEQSLHAAANAQRAMRHGVTTLRDLAGDDVQIAASRAFDRGIMPGPRLLVSGSVGMTAGHQDLFTPPAVRERGPTADSPDECRKLVRRWARAGATGIKIYTSGGVLSMGDKVAWRNQTRAEISATVDEAHALGMLVSAHTHSVEGVQIALESHVDSIEHGTAMTADQAALLAERGTPVGPTLLINEMIAAGRRAGPEAQEKAAALVASRDGMLRTAARLGVRFVLATDASGYFVAFGDQMAEVVRMTEVLGLDPVAALRAATSDAAASMGLSTVTGVLQPGLGADFIVLSGRPWERMKDLSVDNIVAVVCRGQVVAGELP